ncbi:hypothetical protein B0H14DRAFT_2608935 [Mycena olivaceomarginata]|nr:hypothetical protein B0H14DRAFT_2608935 [Mycena olivaceomarginata]
MSSSFFAVLMVQGRGRGEEMELNFQASLVNQVEVVPASRFQWAATVAAFLGIFPFTSHQEGCEIPLHSQISGGGDENSNDATQSASVSQDEPPSVWADMTHDKLYEVARRQFTPSSHLWAKGQEDEIWGMEENKDFNPPDHFGDEGQPANKIQGALRDIYGVVPEDYRDPEDFKRLDSCSGRTSPISQVDRLPTDVRRPQQVLLQHHNVPILHKDYEGKYDLAKFFLHKSLFIAHTTITRGPVTAVAMKAGVPPPKVRSVMELWKLWYTTPGMVAAAGIWCGIRDKMAGGRDFEYYFQLLTKGLQKKKPSILNIFRVWDRKFCPNCKDGLADGVDPDDEGAEGRLATMEEMNAEEPEDGGGGEDEG